MSLNSMPWTIPLWQEILNITGLLFAQLPSLSRFPTNTRLAHLIDFPRRVGPGILVVHKEYGSVRLCYMGLEYSTSSLKYRGLEARK